MARRLMCVCARVGSLSLVCLWMSLNVPTVLASPYEPEDLYLFERISEPAPASVAVALSDGSEAVAHFVVLPPLPAQVAALTAHWSQVAWLPRDYPDPFGRGASVMPWDREDKVRVRVKG